MTPPLANLARSEAVDTGDATPTILWILDGVREAFYVSPTLGDFLGTPLPVDALAAWQALLPGNDRRRWVKAYAEARTQGSPVDLQYRVRSPGGVTHWMREIAHPVRSAIGGVDAFVALTLDISGERRREGVAKAAAEERAKREQAEQRERRARLFASLTTQLLETRGVDGIATIVTQTLVPDFFRCVRFAQVTPVRRIIESAGIPPDGTAACSRRLQFSVSDDSAYELQVCPHEALSELAELPMLEELTACIRLSLRNQGLLEALKGENDARTRALEELRLLEARYRVAASAMSDTVFDYDVVRDQIEISRSVGDVIALREGTLPSALATWRSHVHPEDIAHATLALERVLRGDGERYVGEYRMRRQNGDYATLSFVGSALRNDERAVIRLVGTVRDVTEARAAEARAARERASLEDLVEERTQELSEATGQLTRAARLKDEFLANMSHELRTPLNAILGLTESLQEGVYGAVPEEQLRCLGDIHTSGTHLLSLINDLLDLSKIDAGRITPHPEVSSVSSLVEGALRFVRPIARQRELFLRESIAPRATVVETDPRLLLQILTNLLGNAVKFTASGGDVSLGVAVDEGRSTITFEVRDTGIGIAPAHLPRLFTPFEQLDGGLTRRYGGTGLGLALSNRLARLLGGRILVESEVGRGSTFSVVLPWPSFNAIPSFESVRRVPSAAAQDPLVLIIEDNEANLRTFSGFLSAKGFRIAVARDGLAGLEMVDRLLPDACVVDIQLPELDGLSVIRRIRATPRGAGIPLVVLTALAMTHSRQDCLNAGADEYLTKPVRLQTLRVVLDNLIRREGTNTR